MILKGNLTRLLGNRALSGEWASQIFKLVRTPGLSGISFVWTETLSLLFIASSQYLSSGGLIYNRGL